MSRRNLLEETIETIGDHGHTIEEVEFVTDGQFSCSWGEFARVAKPYYYDSGFGGNEVNINLKIVGDNWWLERHEYDGSEWWEYKQKPFRAVPGVPWIGNQWENPDRKVGY